MTGRASDASPLPSAMPSPFALAGDGTEWVVEAFGCDAARLASIPAMAGLLDAMIASLALRPVAPALWHQFPSPGGVTGLVLLAESHLAVHTFPEHESLCLNLFCCAPRPAWAWEAGLARHVGAQRVMVRWLARGYASLDGAGGAPPDINIAPLAAPTVTLAPPAGSLAPADR